MDFHSLTNTAAAADLAHRVGGTVSNSIIEFAFEHDRSTDVRADVLCDVNNTDQGQDYTILNYAAGRVPSFSFN